MDVVPLLRNDRKAVSKLFRQFERDKDYDTRRSTMRQIVEGLSRHAAIEKQVFQPAVRQATVLMENVAPPRRGGGGRALPDGADRDRLHATSGTVTHMSVEGGSVVFLHAHPDDEAIFTGGTMARLAATGWRVVLVVATGGELGLPVTGSATPEELCKWRMAETRVAAATLGAARVEFLGYRDSGLVDAGGEADEGAFVRAPAAAVAAALAGVVEEERADALVTYDERGIYGHPDHVKVHQVGLLAAERAGTPVVYEATVDREYLHFVETHLVAEAGRSVGELGLAATQLGVPTVAVATMVDVRAVLEVKRRAMAAHASQIPETASAMRLPTEAFSAVYGYEWFLRNGPFGPLDTLT